jgi:hypothetical protein
MPKISQLEAATDITASDLMQVIDIEDTGMAPSGTNKKVTASLLANQLVPLIADNTVSGIKLQDETVSGIKLEDNTVSGIKLEDETVSGIKLEDEAVSGSKIANGTIVNGHVSNFAAIAGTKISPNFGAQAISTTSSITCGGNSTISTLSIGRGKNEISSNTAVGKDAINPLDTVTGTLNTAFGFESLKNLTNGSQNVAIGYGSLSANTSGSSNTAIGVDALSLNTSRSNCSAVGYRALANNQGSYNTAVGASAMGAVNTPTTGGYNVAIGPSALFINASGYENVAIGPSSLGSNSTGIYNTAIGASAMSGTVFFSGSSAIGYDSTVTGSFQVQLGGSSTTPYAYAALQIRSDERDKTDIRDTQLGLDFISSLRPVDYRWDMREDYRPEMPEKPSIDATEEEMAQYEEAKAQWLEAMKLTNITHDGSKKRNRYHHGLIAQEVKTVIEETGVDFGGFQDHSVNGGEDVFSIGYGELVAPLIKSIQELKARVEELESK